MNAADSRHRLAQQIFRGTFAFTAALTLFWLNVLITKTDTAFFPYQPITGEALAQVGAGIAIFHLLWGVIWYGVKNLLLKRFVGFSKAERKAASSSRMHAPFDVADLISRYSERRFASAT